MVHVNTSISLCTTDLRVHTSYLSMWETSWGTHVQYIRPLKATSVCSFLPCCTDVLPPTSLKSAPQSGLPTSVSFIVPHFVTRPGQDLRLVGSLPSLGDWDPSKVRRCAMHHILSSCQRAAMRITQFVPSVFLPLIRSSWFSTENAGLAL